MFAVVESGGKQYRVTEGQEVVVDRLEGEIGERASVGVGIPAQVSALAAAQHDLN